MSAEQATVALPGPDSEDGPEFTDSERAIYQALERGYENAISSEALLAAVDGVGTKSTLRSRIRAMKQKRVPIGGGQALNGYWLITSPLGLQLCLEDIDSYVRTRQQMKDQLRDAYENPVIPEVSPETDGGEPDVSEGVREAVDLLVSECGPEDAAAELRRRFKSDDHDTDEAVAALADLRHRYPEVCP